MDYSISLFWLETVFRFVLFMYKLSTKSSIFLYVSILKSQITLAQTRAQIDTHVCTHTQTNTQMLPSVCRCIHSPSTPFKCSPSEAGLASAFQLTLFRLQMTASTWEMSASLCQRCLASSNICEVLSSSLQLRRAVSQESRLLTHNPAKIAEPSALKHIHSARSFTSTKDCISPKFVVFKAALSPTCKGPCIT